ncbi:hypothetical protein BAY61_14780 [Prauserella marina]|uniref:histidine kinase n=2 Tax=Prauserella marina TaxID=530584 RepID=A0A222VQ70_9PSEU|nr:hypothetical protein BAY61_14780 [Prauserella marina]PWV83984.1 histidine kinase [Prauserella marina]SDC33141.1 Histidine kinase [Prauserella marina]
MAGNRKLQHMKRRARDVLSTVIAVAASLVSSMYVAGAEDYVPGTGVVAFTWWSGLSLLTAAGAAVLLCWRHTLPEIVTAVAVAPPLLLGADSLAALIALAALAASRRDWVLWVGGVLVFTATALAVGRDLGRHPDVTIAGELADLDGTNGTLVWTVVLAAVLTAVALLTGATRGVRGDLRRKEAEEQRLRAEMTRRAERTRIAREMHDVLGHRLSLLSLQAGALEVGGHADPEKAAETARTVRGTARQSLEDLRQVIGVLRDGKGFAEREGDREPAERALPGLADIPELVANSRRSGLTINVTVLIDV